MGKYNHFKHPGFACHCIEFILALCVFILFCMDHGVYEYQIIVIHLFGEEEGGVPIPKPTPASKYLSLFNRPAAILPARQKNRRGRHAEPKSYLTENSDIAGDLDPSVTQAFVQSLDSTPLDSKVNRTGITLLPEIGNKPHGIYTTKAVLPLPLSNNQLATNPPELRYNDNRGVTPKVTLMSFVTRSNTGTPNNLSPCSKMCRTKEGIEPYFSRKKNDTNFFREENNTNFFRERNNTNFLEMAYDANFFRKKNDTNFFREENDTNFFREKNNTNFFREENYTNFFRDKNDTNFFRKKKNTNFFGMAYDANFFRKKNETNFFRDKNDTIFIREKNHVNFSKMENDANLRKKNEIKCVAITNSNISNSTHINSSYSSNSVLLHSLLVYEESIERPRTNKCLKTMAKRQIPAESRGVEKKGQQTRPTEKYRTHDQYSVSRGKIEKYIYRGKNKTHITSSISPKEDKTYSKVTTRILIGRNKSSNSPVTSISPKEDKTISKVATRILIGNNITSSSPFSDEMITTEKSNVTQSWRSVTRRGARDDDDWTVTINEEDISTESSKKGRHDGQPKTDVVHCVMLGFLLICLILVISYLCCTPIWDLTFIIIAIPIAAMCIAAGGILCERYDDIYGGDSSRDDDDKDIKAKLLAGGILCILLGLAFIIDFVVHVIKYVKHGKGGGYGKKKKRHKKKHGKHGKHGKHKKRGKHGKRKKKRHRKKKKRHH